MESREVLLSDALAKLNEMIIGRHNIENAYKKNDDLLNSDSYTQDQIDQQKKVSLEESGAIETCILEENIHFNHALKIAREEKDFYDILFASADFKQWIKQQEDYIKLQQHIDNIKPNFAIKRSTKRQEYFTKFKKMIDQAKDADWFFNMDAHDHPLNKLSAGSKATPEIIKLIHNFKMTVALGTLKSKEFDLKVFEKGSTLPRLNRFDRYFLYYTPSLGEQLKNAFAKKFNKLEHIIHNQNKFNQIGESGIILGIIPSAEIIEKIEETYKKNITIVAIVNTYEFASGEDTLEPHQCQKRGWKHFHLPITDYTQDIESENLLAAAKAIHDAKERGDIVYVHCKAGKARSALVLLVYFAMFNKEFIQTQPPEVLANPGLRLRAALKYIKQFRKQVDLHDELIDAYNEQHNTDAWLSLATDQYKLKKEIKVMFPDKNIGKLCSGCNAISLAMDMLAMEKPILNPELKGHLGENIFTSEKFMHELVQSFAFKELILFTWKIQKLKLSETIRVNYLNAFLEDLKDNPAHAIKELQSNFEKIDPASNVGSLLLNSKAEQVIGILHRLYLGIENYKRFKSFEVNLRKEFNITEEQFDSYIKKVPADIQNETLNVLFKIKNLAEGKNKFVLFLPTSLTSAVINNLHQVCQVYTLYKKLKWDDTFRKETLSFIGVPFGPLLAKLSDAEEKTFINCLVKLNEAWTKEIKLMVKRDKISSLAANDLPPLSQHSSGLFTFIPSRIDDSVQEKVTKNLTHT